MTTAYNPFREMDRLFNQAARTATEGRFMPMDLYRDGDEFVVKMDLPGVDVDSIDIDVDDRTLTVRAERKQEEMKTTSEDNRWLTRERSYGSFARQLTLGTGLNLAQISAEYNDGVLVLTIPVAEEAKPRKIKVGATSSAKQVGAGNDVPGEVAEEHQN